MEGGDKMVHIYCGDGKGKTTAATGLAIRMAGSGKKVLFVQFFKSDKSSEINILKSIDNIRTLHLEKNYGRYKNMTQEVKQQAYAEYRNLFKRAIETAVNENFDMLVLDEIISAYNYEFVEREELKDFLDKYGQEKEIVMTGRNPAKELIEMSDYVSSIEKLKHPFDKGVKARKGIEF